MCYILIIVSKTLYLNVRKLKCKLYNNMINICHL